VALEEGKGRDSLPEQMAISFLMNHGPFLKIHTFWGLLKSEEGGLFEDSKS
jgi:hypothetical protein